MITSLQPLPVRLRAELRPALPSWPWEHATVAEHVDAPVIVWDTASLFVNQPDQRGPHGPWSDPASALRTLELEPSWLELAATRVSAWLLTFVRSQSDQHRCDGPMETTRRVARSRADATAALGRIGSVDWSSKAGAGHLDLGTFRSTPGEPGRPWVAAAVLHEHRSRRLNVSVAIFTWGNDRCGITIRPNYRRPWSRRRLHRCLRSTHSAADRLREIVLAPGDRPLAHDPI